MNIDIALLHSKELSVQRAQIRLDYVWVRVCWLAGQCGRKFSVENNHSGEQSVLPEFFKQNYL
jgi:hypothetical protein